MEYNTELKEMIKIKKEKYLGSIITDTGKQKENIEERKNKGMGLQNHILSIPKEVSFGMYAFETALILRTSLLINGILFNLEASNRILKEDIKNLEDTEHALFRSPFQAPASTPLESFYIECGIFPMRYILQARRFMYLWSLLQKKIDELVKKIFDAQVEFSHSDDFVSNIKNELKEFQIDLEFEVIAKYRKDDFKKIMKNKIAVKTKEY